jgi:uncharacterized membrane protein
MQAGTLAMDVYSAVNSSPWSAETFGGNEERAASCMKYVKHAIVLTGIFVLAASLISHSWWPLIGAGVAGAYMYWLYDNALSIARNRGHVGQIS